MTLEQRLTALATRIGNYIRDSVLTRVLPTGGTAGQVLKKTSANDFAVGWAAEATGADPWTRLYLAADFANATVTFNDVTGLTITIPAATDFVIEADLLLNAGNATTNLPLVGWSWSAALAWGASELWYQSSSSARILTEGFNHTAAGTLRMAAGTAPVLGTYLAGGMFKGRTGAAAVTIKLQLAAESAATAAATMKAKSEMRVRSGF